MTSELKHAVSVIEKTITNAKDGLPDSVFFMVTKLTPMINVDLIIRNDAGQILLTWRADQFYGPGWHIPGGIIRFKETWEDRIAAVAKSELGATVSFNPIPLSIRQTINPNRDVRGHFISMIYECRLTSPLDESLKAKTDPPLNGEWAWHDGFPDNILPVQRKIYGELFQAQTQETYRQERSLEGMLVQSHPLLQTAKTIDWSTREPRLFWGLHLLGVIRGLHDQDLLEQWLENPYFQAFCGETVFCSECKVDVTQLTQWRGQIGDDVLSEWTRRVLPVQQTTKVSTFVIDVDGVVAMLTPGNDYTLSQPVTKVVSAINRLYDAGHKIIMMTARGSATGLSWEQVTTDQFKAWGLKYHELRFGKPAADYYVDDRMVSVEMLYAMANGREFPPSTRAPRLDATSGQNENQ